MWLAIHCRRALDVTDELFADQPFKREIIEGAESTEGADDALGNQAGEAPIEALVRALAQVADLVWTAALVGSDRADRDYAARLRAQIATAGLGERITVPEIRERLEAAIEAELEAVGV